MTQWQPFETAPEDGAVILAYRPDAGVFTAHFIEPEWRRQSWGWSAALAGRPRNIGKSRQPATSARTVLRRSKHDNHG